MNGWEEGVLVPRASAARLCPLSQRSLPPLSSIRVEC